MKRNYLTGALVALMAVAVMGFVTQGFAEEETPAPKSGMGFHDKRPAGECPGMAAGEMGYGKNLNLTKEEREKVDAEINAFRESTKDLRRDIYQKFLELQSEMAKKDPDSKKAFEIQKQISDLRGQMEQKRLEHRFNLKKINPDLGNGMGRFHDGNMRGKGGHEQCPRKM
jgi:Spy/CpxP family protein refolding chaperone